MKKEFVESMEWAIAYTLDYLLKSLLCGGLMLMPMIPLLFM